MNGSSETVLSDGNGILEAIFYLREYSVSRDSVPASSKRGVRDGLWEGSDKREDADIEIR